MNYRFERHRCPNPTSPKKEKVVRRSAMSSRESGSRNESYLSCVLICVSEIRFEHRRRPSPTTQEKVKAVIDEGSEEISDEFERIRIAQRIVLAVRSHALLRSRKRREK
ncbi:hypothetical protein TIFTF001_036708 [Ficus carica]|uniref:Uncharacterized protein n=1 Tax=Ficus carica TaxID=3494 RepID=A0AA88E3X4_FICCA|nr:hypothetical protein TIFTF001_036708 [Ficus carica]